MSDRGGVEATGRETIIESTTNTMILIVDHYYRDCVVCFTRATFNGALASISSFSKRERKRERERERSNHSLEFLSRRVVFSFCCVFFLSRSLGCAADPCDEYCALHFASNDDTKNFQDGPPRDGHRQAKR